MLNALDHVAASCVLAGVFKVAESLVFAFGSGASLDKELKKDTENRIILKFDDLFRCGGHTIKCAHRHRRAATFCHFQVPHSTNDSGNLWSREVRTYPQGISEYEEIACTYPHFML